MSEYWKSVPRKFCDFCKCWITDNKPSVDFHERGKRHKENVELKLKEIRKKSLENSLQANEVKSEMDKLEMAALEAFKKDLRDNPELAAQYGVSLEAKPPAVTENDGKSSTLPARDRPSTEVKADPARDQPSTEVKADPARKRPSTEVKADASRDQPSTEVKADASREWFEAVSPEGYHYYWNTSTGESTWEAPKEYVSVQEQEADHSKDDPIAGAATESSSEADAYATSEDVKPAVKARLDPSNSRSAYGAWDVVKEIEQPVIYSETSAPPAVDDIPLPSDTPEVSSDGAHKMKFKEKTVTSISSTSGAAVAFKKRKIASGARNVRQKDNND